MTAQETEQLAKTKESEVDAAPPEASADEQLPLAEFTPGVTDLWAVGAEQGYDHLMRVAEVFANSEMVPVRYRGPKKVNDCAIVIAMALKHQADILGFMQNVYVVHGTPGMEAKLAIALANMSGVWKAPIAYKMTGEKGTPERTCTAWAHDSKSNEYCEMDCSLDDANKQGWTKPVPLKGGGTMLSKWVIMPEMMLRYRAAMNLMRLYHPEVLFGMKTIQELDDIGPRDVEVEAVSETAQAIADKVEASRKELPKPAEEDETPIAEAMEGATKVVETEPAPKKAPPANGSGKQSTLLDQPKTEPPKDPPSSQGLDELVAAGKESMSDSEMREHRKVVIAKYEDLLTATDAASVDLNTTRTSTVLEECVRLNEVLKERH